MEDNGGDTLPTGDSHKSSSMDSDSDVEWEEVEPEWEESWPEAMRAHGLVGHSFTVPVELSGSVEVKETEDNSTILATLRERKQLLVNHLLPTLNKCLEWMTKAGEGDSVRAAIDLKTKVNGALAKYRKLDITFQEPEATPTTNQDTVSAARTETASEWKFGTDVPKSITVADLELDPTTPQAQLAILKRKLGKKVSSSAHAQSSERQGNSSKKPANLKAPVIPFGMDLYHWGDSSSSVEARTLAPLGSLHRFWAQETEVNISKDEQDRLKCRTISFPGQFQPVMRSCRAPLPSGKLCPRKDRHKCPFHGVIIPRDEAGNPASQELGRAELSQGSDVPPLWQDQELQRDIMCAKGLELHDVKGKRGRGKGKLKAKFPGLTDLKARVDTPRRRVERKVLSKQSLKRVSEHINQLATKKYNDKFGNNFNYALKN